MYLISVRNTYLYLLPGYNSYSLSRYNPKQLLLTMKPILTHIQPNYHEHLTRERDNMAEQKRCYCCP
jgi:hypothetical protein